ncbi:MAG: hypothetical protein A4E36_02102 [Methanoregulaceae archaeon PtaB.Bin009]|jgi:hypothetical protein|nr:MAG: hypothetical protein A4E36_02102 [Methanoregulaceae archaeon PtaB.Bin009]
MRDSCVPENFRKEVWSNLLPMRIGERKNQSIFNHKRVFTAAVRTFKSQYA